MFHPQCNLLFSEQNGRLGVFTIRRFEPQGAKVPVVDRRILPLVEVGANREISRFGHRSVLLDLQSCEHLRPDGWNVS